MLEKLPDAVGHALREQRAGLDQVAFQRIPLRTGQAAITVQSLAFIDHGPIPVRYTADGEGISPPLHWQGVPANAESVVLIVEDADSPTPKPLVHAIAVDLPALDESLPEGALDAVTDAGPHEAHEVHEALELRMGRNSYFQTGWLAPDPPPAHGLHRYVFQVFALGPGEPLSSSPGREAVLAALAARAIASGCLIGTYERHDTSVHTDAPLAVPTA